MRCGGRGAAFHRQVPDARREDRHAVEDDRDVRPDGGDLVVVPFADRAQMALLRGDDAVDRAAVLPRLVLLLERTRVVEDLDLHAVVGGVAEDPAAAGKRAAAEAFPPGADREAVVAVRHELELEARGEVGELLFVEEVAEVLRSLPEDELAVLDVEEVRRARPAGEVAPVEDRAVAVVRAARAACAARKRQPQRRRREHVHHARSFHHAVSAPSFGSTRPPRFQTRPAGLGRVDGSVAHRAGRNAKIS